MAPMAGRDWRGEHGGQSPERAPRPPETHTGRAALLGPGDRLSTCRLFTSHTTPRFLAAHRRNAFRRTFASRISLILTTRLKRSPTGFLNPSETTSPHPETREQRRLQPGGLSPMAPFFSLSRQFCFLCWYYHVRCVSSQHTHKKKQKKSLVHAWAAAFMPYIPCLSSGPPPLHRPSPGARHPPSRWFLFVFTLFLREERC